MFEELIVLEGHEEEKGSEEEVALDEEVGCEEGGGGEADDEACADAFISKFSLEEVADELAAVEREDRDEVEEAPEDVEAHGDGEDEVSVGQMVEGVGFEEGVGEEDEDALEEGAAECDEKVLHGCHAVAVVLGASSEGFEDDLRFGAEIEGGESMSKLMDEEAKKHDATEDKALDGGVLEHVGKKEQKEPEGGVDVDGDV